MKIGERKYGGSVCDIGFAHGIPPHMKHDVRLICNLRTAPASRGQGHATELLNRIAAEADRFKVILILNPQASADAPTTEQLVEWYGSMGYQEIQKEPLLMARMFTVPAAVQAAKETTSRVLEIAK